MRKMLAFALVLTFVGSAVAADLGNQAPLKSDPIVPENVPQARQGGDTVFDAVAIPGLPYSNTGTTAGYTDDYDEACPYTGSTSPDVVYSYTPAGPEGVTIDLCGSSYDTKLYVYDADLNLVACNDDYYSSGDPCGSFVSRLENVGLTGGTTYYFIIDGYGDDFGDYVIDVQGFEPCVLDCPAGAQLEGEPALGPGYADSYNGGCNSDTPIFQTLEADANGDLTMCGISGWYDNAGTPTRDTDWFIVNMGASGTADFVIDAEYAVSLFELSPQDCDNVAVAQSVEAGPCNEASLAVSGYGEGAPVWMWVGPTVFEAPGDDDTFDYVLMASGLLPGTIATENTSWSSMKALYQ